MTVTIETSPAGTGKDWLDEWVAMSLRKGKSQDVIDRVVANVVGPVTIETSPAGRDKTCQNCGVGIVQMGNKPKKFCSARCRVAHNRKK